MIIKAQNVDKIEINSENILLFYGLNQGLKQEKIDQVLSKNKDRELFKYDESQIINDESNFYDNFLSKSLFGDKKILIINRATDKIFKIIDDLKNKINQDILLILNSDNLDKKSKLRNLFEKDKKLKCVAFYPDTLGALNILTSNFFKENKVNISQSDINLILSKCNGDRGILKNELNKIEYFIKNKKKITTQDIIKLTNLIENHQITELVDNCLAKNQFKTKQILNENNFGTEDSIIIARTFIQRLKRLLILSNNYIINKNLEKTISDAKPPIFWKDKDIVKQQIIKWKINEVKKLLYYLTDLELQIKKNLSNSVNIIIDFVLHTSSSKINNET